jgi:hypothetical protein
MVFASLAWTLKQWSGLMVRRGGNPAQAAARAALHRRLLRMEFATYLNSLMLIPAQIVRTSRRVTFRILAYRPSLDCLLALHDHCGISHKQTHEAKVWMLWYPPTRPTLKANPIDGSQPEKRSAAHRRHAQPACLFSPSRFNKTDSADA